MVRALAQAVQEAGIPKGRLLEAAGIDPDLLEQIDARLSFGQYGQAQRAAVALTGDPALGLRLGQHAAGAAFDLVGHLSEHAPTLRQALEAMVQYSRLLADQPSLALVEEGERASFRVSFPPPWRGRGLWLPSELTLSGSLRLLRMVAGPNAAPLRACFPYEAPPHHGEYERMFGHCVHFGQPFAGLEFDRGWLELRQLHANPELHAALEAQAQHRLQRASDGLSLAERVRLHLSGCDPRQMPDMAEVARSFGMSARSLRRKLDGQQADYRGLVEAARADIAKRMLGEPTRSIEEIAARMGFASPSGFHRAFKRWTGQTPSQFRATR